MKFNVNHVELLELKSNWVISKGTYVNQSALIIMYLKSIGNHEIQYNSCIIK